MPVADKMQHRTLHVLLVEDSPDDADLILFELNNAAFSVVGARVETAGQMRAAMEDGGWDVIISDFNLPAFNAHEALAVLHETGADIPFLVVSGYIGEEGAVSLMREGASDFVMKDRLVRLVPAVERALREAALRQAHREVQERLRENERMLDGVTAALGEGIFVLNGGGALVFMNPEAERLLGWAVTELRGKDMHRIIHSQKADGSPLSASCCGILGVLENNEVCRSEDDAFMCKDGALMPVSFVASPIMENGKVVASVVAFQDISRRKQAEQELLESRRQLRELLTYVQTVREEERTRIARELHDELGQMLTGVKLDTMWLASRLPGGMPAITGKIASMSRLIDETLDAIRRVAADLRPIMLDDLGLVAAVEWLVEDFGERTGIRIRLGMEDMRHDCQDLDLDANVSTAVFRIVQECLTNAARHANAEQVLVSLECCNGNLMLMVSDNGRGMDIGSMNGGNSLGIIGMRERAQAVGGTFHLFSTSGGGTTVVAVIPAKPAELNGAVE